MPRPSTRSCSSGFSLVELIVAMAVTLLITGAALSLAMTSRRLHDTDTARVRLAQSMRASEDFLVADIRQAGERLAGDVPALGIVDGGPGAPDVLIVRRNEIGTVLRSCRDVEGTTRRIHIAERPPSGCLGLPDADGDGWQDDHQVWRERRIAAGGRISAYLYNPRNGQGEFFTYVDDDDDSGSPSIEAESGHSWNTAFRAGDFPRVYMLEERRYALREGLLQLTINGDTANPVNLVDHLDDFQAAALFRDGTRAETLDHGDAWTELRAIRIDVEGSIELRDRTLRRRWSNEIMPRNTLSH